MPTKRNNPQIKDIKLSQADLELPVKELCAKYNISHSHACKLRKRFGKSILKRPEKEILIKLYCEDYLSQSAIAEMFSVTPKTVGNWLIKYSIPIREHGYNQRLHSVPKCRQTNLERYGQDTIFRNKDFISNNIKNKIEKYGCIVPNQPISNLEKSIAEYLSDLGFIFSSNYSIISPKQIDLYNDSLKIGIEVCGLRWHTEKTGKNRNYHNTKRLLCNSIGVRLLTIYEDEWNYRTSQVKGYIKSLLGKNKRIFARKCKVQEIPKELASKFIDEFHIQPLSFRRIHLAVGIYSDDMLVGVMAFSKHHRNNSTNQIVLSRLCFKNVTVVGGASKLLSYAINKLTGDFDYILSWSDNRWSEGNVYSKLGFYSDGELPPDYSYVYYKNPKERIPKQTMTRKSLGCSPRQTEKQRAEELGFYRIWDCGKIRWKLKIKKAEK